MAVSPNWKLTLAYDGSGFHGWQIQAAHSGLATVQGTLAQAIERLTGETVLPQGSGRTDAGVHALAQVCSFRLAAPVPAQNLQRALNRILPATIRVLSCEEVPDSFHARHSARSKTYEYRVFERRPERRRTTPGQPAIERICSPFLAPFAWDCRWPLSLEAMQQAAQLLLGTHDFTSMAATDPDRSVRDSDQNRSQRDQDEDSPRAHPTKINPVKTITHASWSRVSSSTSADPGPWPLGPGPWALDPGPSLLFHISGNGFLHHMVRNIVGTLVEIGRGSLEPSDLTRILEARDRTAAGPTAPARGLYLVEVLYDPELTDNAADHQHTGCPIDDAVVMGGVKEAPDHPHAGCPIHDAVVGGVENVENPHEVTS
jgi:tRNA pseudouridine38-40 synthase